MAFVKLTKEERMKLLKPYTFDDLGGYNILHWIVEENIKDIVDKFTMIDIRDDDVFTIGFIRSGNHWTYEVINMIQNQNLDLKKEDYIHQLVEYTGGDVCKIRGQDPSPRQLVTHTWIDTSLPKQALEKKTKIVYILRNPKDVVVSWFNFMTSFKKELDCYNFLGNFDAFLQVFFENEMHYGGWCEHVLNFEKFMQEHPKMPVHLHVYEEMVENPIEATRNLCKFLGYPDDLVTEITQHTTMDAMLKNSKKYENFDKKIFKEGERVILRKGQVGGWKTYFTDEQNQYFDEEFEKRMTGSKLADRIRPYLKK